MKKTIRCIFEVEVQDEKELDNAIEDMYYVDSTHSLSIVYRDWRWDVVQVKLLDIQKIN